MFEDLKLPNNYSAQESSTFPARSCAGVRHGAGPPVRQVISDHACLSSIPLRVFLYLLWREAEEEVSGGGGGEKTHN